MRALRIISESTRKYPRRRCRHIASAIIADEGCRAFSCVDNNLCRCVTQTNAVVLEKHVPDQPSWRARSLALQRRAHSKAAIIMDNIVPEHDETINHGLCQAVWIAAVHQLLRVSNHCEGEAVLQHVQRG